MGMNYYWHRKPPCECCGRPFEPFHIGKSSRGWYFHLHVIPEEAIGDLCDWKKRWKRPGSYIYDEGGRVIPPERMEEIITKRGPWANTQTDAWWEPLYSSEEEFYRRNNCEPGQDGLVRARLGVLCIGYGDGPWDLFVGEFS